MARPASRQSATGKRSACPPSARSWSSPRGMLVWEAERSEQGGHEGGMEAQGETTNRMQDLLGDEPELARLETGTYLLAFTRTRWLAVPKADTAQAQRLGTEDGSVVRAGNAASKRHDR